MLVDTHIHLDDVSFAADRAELLRAAERAGVCRFVVPAVDLASCAGVCDLARSVPGCAYALGIHPLYVDRAHEADIAALHALLAEGGACAVGEIGLDAYVSQDLRRQEWFFAEQLKLAQAFDLPVILHVRRAQDRVLKYLRRHRVRGGIAHAFNGSLQQAQAFIDLGFKLGFGGAMSYTGSTRIRALAASLPLESIVLESDAPDMAPAWAAGERNTPEQVARYARLLADLRGLPVELIEQATTHNATQALGFVFA